MRGGVEPPATVTGDCGALVRSRSGADEHEGVPG